MHVCRLNDVSEGIPERAMIFCDEEKMPNICVLKYNTSIVLRKRDILLFIKKYGRSEKN